MKEPYRQENILASANAFKQQGLKWLNKPDAYGAILEEVDMLWLKLARKNDIYSMHWSMDDDEYKMARLSAMPHSDTVKIGIEAQCPVGERATHEAIFFSVEELTVNDLRNIQE